MLRLPISGLWVVVRPPTGVEDLLLQEAGELDARLGLRLLDSLARPADQAAVDWKGFTMTDFEALLLMLRRATLGDLIRAEANCAGCGAKTDVSFRISEFLASQKLRRPRGVEKIDGDDAYRLSGEGVQFRLPNCGDLTETDRQMNWEIELIRKCAQPAEVPVRMRRRIERAMEFLAPRLSRILAGKCPECQASMNFYFDVQQFVLRELRENAAMVFEDVHLLALYYKWSEQDILALPRSRRAYYADALRSQRGAA